MAAVAGYLRLRPATDETKIDASSSGRFEPRTSDPFDAPPPPPKGDAKLRGTVLGPDGKGAAGVTVIAVETVGDALSGRECSCGGIAEPGSTMFDCGCRSNEDIVAAVSRREGEPQLLARAITDATGSFELTGLPTEPVALWAQHPSQGVALLDKVKPPDHPTLILAPAIEVRGRVTDEEKRPLSKALVTVVVETSSRFFETLSDEQGEYKVGGLPFSDYSVIAAHEGKQSGYSSARPDEATDVDFQLAAPVRLNGRVMRQGAPAGGAEVVLTFDEDGIASRTTRSLADGRFSFDELPMSEAQLSATLGDDSGFVRVYGDLAARGEIVIALEPAGRVEGSVVDLEGRPISGVAIAVFSNHPGGQDQRSGADGRFRVQLLPGTWRLSASKDGYLAHQDVGCAVKAGEVVTVEVKLEPGVRISGQVATRDGQPIADAEVTVDSVARDEDGDSRKPLRSNGRRGRSNLDGVFELDGLEPGVKQLVVRHPDWQPSRLRVTAPSERLDVRLEPGGSIEGHLAEADGAPIAAATVTVVANVMVDTRRPIVELDDVKTIRTEGDGSFRVHGLVPGRYVVTAVDKASGRAVTANAEVSSGTSSVALRFQAGLSLAGKVVDQNGAPVPRATLRLSPVEPPSPGPSWIHRRNVSLPELEAHSRSCSVKSDEQGHFEAHHLPAGPIEIAAQADGYSNESPATVSAGAQDVTLKLRRVPRLKGRVRSSEGGPVKSFIVQGEQVTSDDGSFDIAREHLGDIEIAAAGFAPLTVERTHGDHGDADVGTVTLSKGRTVELRVTDRRTGAPLEGARPLGVVDPTEDEFERELVRPHVSDVTGRLKLEHLPEAPQTLQVSHEKYRVSDVELPRGVAQVDVALDPGESISGHVTDAAGKPVTQGTVHAYQTHDDATAPLEQDGSYHLDGLAPGPWQVRVTVPRARLQFRPQQVTAGGGQPAVADFRPLAGDAKLQVVVVDSKGEELMASLSLLPGAIAAPSDYAAYRRLAESSADPTEGDTFAGLDPGHYTILVMTRIAGPLGVFCHPVDVVSGSQTVRLSLPADLVQLSEP